MKKDKLQMVNGTKIYSLDYLTNEELSDLDLNNLFDTKSLIYSFIIEMFKFIHSKKRPNEIIKMVKNENNWMDRYSWSIKERSLFESKLAKAFKNIYQYNDKISLGKAQWFSIFYGFKTKGGS